MLLSEYVWFVPVFRRTDDQDSPHIYKGRTSHRCAYGCAWPGACMYGKKYGWHERIAGLSVESRYPVKQVIILSL